MRLTLAIARQQEFLADQEAVRIVGAKIAAQALRHVGALAPAYLA